MKCPMCGADTLDDLVVKGEMTNEEWIKSLDTEQLAEWLVFKRKLLRIPETNYEVWIQWLKEKHTE